MKSSFPSKKSFTAIFSGQIDFMYFLPILRQNPEIFSLICNPAKTPCINHVRKSHTFGNINFCMN